MMMIALLLAVAAAAAPTANSRSSRDVAALFQDVSDAFDKDGFTIVETAVWGSGKGVRAESKNSTVFKTGKKKRAYYVEGTAYEMGFLNGYLGHEEVEVLVTTFLENVVPQLINPHFIPNEKYRQEELLELVRILLTDLSYRSFMEDIELFPMSIVEQMHGIADGCAHRNSSTQATFAHLVAVNYGFDYIVAKVYSGDINPLLQQIMHDQNISCCMNQNVCPDPKKVYSEERYLRCAARSHLSYLLTKMFPAVMVPAYCDAFGARRKANADPSAAYFARDFQFPTGTVFQDIAAMTIFRPTDGGNALVAVATPGMIGAMTAVNEHGVSMGVDQDRSRAVNSEHPGLNSLLLIRHVMDKATDLASAIDTLAHAPQGVAWLYPLCDGAGDCAIVEAAAHRNESLPPPDPLRFVQSLKIKKKLPSEQFFDDHSSVAEYRAGMYIRYMNYTYPEEYLSFNKGLFEAAGVPYNPDVWGETGALYTRFEDERESANFLRNNYFSPQREDKDDLVLLGNIAIVPEARAPMMDGIPELLAKSATCPQWRYDTLNAFLLQNYGAMTWEKSIEAITFLSPERTPGYWNTTVVPGDEMTAIVEGTISVVDLVARKITTKTGYWCDDFTTLVLPNYLK